MPLQIQEKFRTPNIEDQKKNFPYHIIMKTLNIQNKESRKKKTHQVTYEARSIRITADYQVRP